MVPYASRMNENIIKTCINNALYNLNSCIGYTIFLQTYISIILYLTSSIKQASKHICMKTDEKLLMNNIMELISVRVDQKTTGTDNLENENVECLTLCIS